MSNLSGLLFIGDPHLSSKAMNYRKDDYEQVSLEKFKWCIDYAHNNNLMPILLGDLFHSPRTNSNTLICRLLDIISEPVPAILGNHDVKYNEINNEDSISILIKAKKLCLLDNNPIITKINNRHILIGGSSWNKKSLPTKIDLKKYFPNLYDQESCIVIWICHHNLDLLNYETNSKKIFTHEIENLNFVINGHIHTPQEDQIKGQTCWLTPGSITRTKRGKNSEKHIPSVLRFDITKTSFEKYTVPVPHKKYDQVFYEKIEAIAEDRDSLFIASLAELQERKTDSGTGLEEFLNENLHLFSKEVGNQLIKLSKEVLNG